MSVDPNDPQVSPPDPATGAPIGPNGRPRVDRAADLVAMSKPERKQYLRDLRAQDRADARAAWPITLDVARSKHALWPINPGYWRERARLARGEKGIPGRYRRGSVFQSPWRWAGLALLFVGIGNHTGWHRPFQSKTRTVQSASPFGTVPGPGQPDTQGSDSQSVPKIWVKDNVLAPNHEVLSDATREANAEKYFATHNPEGFPSEYGTSVANWVAAQDQTTQSAQNQVAQKGISAAAVGEHNMQDTGAYAVRAYFVVNENVSFNSTARLSGRAMAIAEFKPDAYGVWGWQILAEPLTVIQDGEKTVYAGKDRSDSGMDAYDRQNGSATFLYDDGSVFKPGPNAENVFGRPGATPDVNNVAGTPPPRPTSAKIVYAKSAPTPINKTTVGITPAYQGGEIPIVSLDGKPAYEMVGGKLKWNPYAMADPKTDYGVNTAFGQNRWLSNDVDPKDAKAVIAQRNEYIKEFGIPAGVNAPNIYEDMDQGIKSNGSPLNANRKTVTNSDSWMDAMETFAITEPMGSRVPKNASYTVSGLSQTQNAVLTTQLNQGRGSSNSDGGMGRGIA